jgi:hypothetical protein
MKQKTWKVVKWSRESEWKNETISLQCNCGRDAECPVLDSIHASRPIGATGMGIIFDTDPGLIGEGCFPEIIECRKCHRRYSGWGSMIESEGANVR